MNKRFFLETLKKLFFTYLGMLLFPYKNWCISAMDYALMGQDYIQKKQFKEAVKVLIKSINIDSESNWAYGLLGRAYNSIGNIEQSVESFRKALRLNSDDTYSRMMIEIITQKPLNLPKKIIILDSDTEKEAYNEENSSKYQSRKVVIDPGHGGFDLGAVGQDGAKEKDITLDIGLKLYKKLLEEKIKAFMTRTGDYYVSLSDRTVTANQYRADLFISIHINGSQNNVAKGVETYFCSEKASSSNALKVAAFENSVLKYDEPFTQKTAYIDLEDILFQLEQKLYWNESASFANIFQKNFIENLPFENRGIHSANFYVLRNAKMPAILLETGFISNPKESYMLKNPVFRDKIVDSIVNGVII